nr:50S ribosomal protein [Ipomoea batatas]
MALRAAMLKSCGGGVSNMGFPSSLRRLAHGIAQPAPLDSAIGGPAPTAPPLLLPEFDESIKGDAGDITFINGSMELMAVPKKKVSRHKRGIRNGPKALKPQPVIIRCKVCGRVKLPHFFCCSGIRQDPEQ